MKSSVKKNAGNFQIARTRKFPHTTISLAALRRMMNLESPCWKFYADGLGLTFTSAQRQNWILFGGGTCNDHLLYHTYNPLVGSPFVPTVLGMTTPSTILEWERNTMYVINTSVNCPVLVTAYLVKPRMAITIQEADLAAGGNGSGSVINGATNSAAVFESIMRLAATNVLNSYKAAPSTGTSMQKFDWDELGQVPFNNRYFCQKFKVLKSKKFTMQPGRRAVFTVSGKRAQINGYKLGYYCYKNEGDPTPSFQQQHCMLPKDTRFWMIAYHSHLQLYTTKDTHEKVVGFDAPPAVLTTYHTRQFCIRIDSSQPQPLVGRLNAVQTLGTSQPRHIGGRMYPGETVPTFISATPDVPQPPPIATLPTTFPYYENTNIPQYAANEPYAWSG